MPSGNEWLLRKFIDSLFSVSMTLVKKVPGIFSFALWNLSGKMPSTVGSMKGTFLFLLIQPSVLLS
jgi:hypothetical protein